MEWSIVIPVKRLSLAKSRLQPVAVGGPELALAFVCDTVAAVLGTPAARRVVVVTDDEQVAAAARRLGAVVIADPGGGMNAAVVRGATFAGAVAAEAAVASLPSDLPALRSEELQRALCQAAELGRSFVPDAADVGTTLLAAVPGQLLGPRYGASSTRAHAGSGAVVLHGDWPTLRRDVDTAEDLRDARALGLGPVTSTLLAAALDRAG